MSAVPAVVTADAVVSIKPVTEAGMVGRINQLCREGVIEKCRELYNLVATLKSQVRARGDNWTLFVAKNFTFSLQSANNYVRLAANGVSGPVRHLHASGRPGYQKPTTDRVPSIKSSKTVVVDAEIIEKATTTTASPGDDALDDLRATAAKADATFDRQIADEKATRPVAQTPSMTLEAAIAAINSTAQRGVVGQLRIAQGQVTKLENQLAQAREKLLEKQREVIEAAKLLKDGAA